MGEPKWQRARFVKSLYAPQIIGREIWAMRPVLREALDALSMSAVPAQEMCCVNARSADGSRIAFDPTCLEFLARDENDFADDVPMFKWEEFVAGERDPFML